MYEIIKSDISVIPKHITKSQVDEISEVIKGWKYLRKPEYQRDRDILIHRLMWQTGGRVDDICHLTVEMLVWKDSLIRLWTKKRKKEVYLQMEKSILYDLKNFKENYNISTGRFWDITRQRVWQKTQKWAEKIGIRLHPHMYRHGNAVYLMLKQQPTALISARLGHANTAITQSMYQKVTPEMQKELLKDVEF